MSRLVLASLLLLLLISDGQAQSEPRLGGAAPGIGIQQGIPEARFSSPPRPPESAPPMALPAPLPAPVTPPGPTTPNDGNTTVIINPGGVCNNPWGNGFGWNQNRANNYLGYSYGGWGNTGYGYQQGYYQGAVDRENQLLREEMLRQRWQFEQQAARQAQEQQANQPAEPARSSAKERVERNRAEASLRSGMRHFQKGSYLQAAQKFEQARVLPKASALFLAGQAYIAAGHFDRAIASIKAGIEQNPDWPSAEIDLGTLYTDRDDLVEHMGMLARQIKQRPKDADLLFLLGFELLGIGERDKARALIDQAVKLSSDDRHLKPFVDFFASLEEAEPEPKKETARGSDIPVPEFLQNLAGERRS
jgi:tetratricopeptide (TPR) repeat protein